MSVWERYIFFNKLNEILNLYGIVEEQKENKESIKKEGLSGLKHGTVNVHFSTLFSPDDDSVYKETELYLH